MNRLVAVYAIGLTAALGIYAACSVKFWREVSKEILGELADS